MSRPDDQSFPASDRATEHRLPRDGEATASSGREQTVADAFHSATLRLDRIVEQLQGIHVSLESMRVSLSGLTRTAEDHEVRLRRLESWSQRLTPLVSLVTFVAGAIATAFIGGLIG